MKIQLFTFFFILSSPVFANEWLRVSYNNPHLTTDLAVGLWAYPLPMDYDEDGDMDLLVSCTDKPYYGTYYFENISDSNQINPLFKAGVRIGGARKYPTITYLDDDFRVLISGKEALDFKNKCFDDLKKLNVKQPVHEAKGKIRSRQWSYVDYDGDEVLDLIVGIGDWSDYGWDNAYDSSGEWKSGSINGYVYFLKNFGTNDLPEYDSPEKILVGDLPLNTYGTPSPNFADFDGDGDLDLLCGEFIDQLHYFENVGTRFKPIYSKCRPIQINGEVLFFDLCMIIPVVVDWDFDGDADVVVGVEDGRILILENTGEVVDGLPVFKEPKYFQQKADGLKFGVLSTPVSVDWDADGDEDLICGNTAGYIGFIENLDGSNNPRWAKPIYLESPAGIIRIMAGENGSIQGPAEKKWGYTTLSVKDWDHDGLLDVVVNSIWGKVVWYKNIGSATEPRLDFAQPVIVKWQGNTPKPFWNWWDPCGANLVTQWRTTPVVVDWTADGLNDLVMLDTEGYLALYERVELHGELRLMPPKRVFYMNGSSGFKHRHQPVNMDSGLLQLNVGVAGRSGRRKLCIEDLDCDGDLDIIVNGINAHVLWQTDSTNGLYIFEDSGPLGSQILAGHTTSPTVTDWDNDGVKEILLGAEDGFFYRYTGDLNID